MKSGRWGVFRITGKRATAGSSSWGSYQVNCPFHAKSKVSGCKRTLKIPSPSRAEQLSTLRRLMFWCARATTCQRQRVHMRLPLDPVPPDPVLVAMRIDAHPGRIQTDEELDEAEAALLAASAAGLGVPTDTPAPPAASASGDRRSGAASSSGRPGRQQSEQGSQLGGGRRVRAKGQAQGGVKRGRAKAKAKAKAHAEPPTMEGGQEVRSSSSASSSSSSSSSSAKSSSSSSDSAGADDGPWS